MVKHYNIFGFKSYTDVCYPSCSTCHAVLIKNPKELTQLTCPICGLVYEEAEQIQRMEDEKNKPGLTPKISQLTSNRPMILQGKGKTKTRRNKKMYDDLGNKINQQDADIMNDLAQGRHVKYYKETVYDSALKDDKSKS